MTSRGQEGREDALVMMVVCAEWSEGFIVWMAGFGHGLFVVVALLGGSPGSAGFSL